MVAFSNFGCWCDVSLYPQERGQDEVVDSERDSKRHRSDDGKCASVRAGRWVGRQAGGRAGRQAGGRAGRRACCWIPAMAVLQVYSYCSLVGDLLFPPTMAVGLGR